MTEPKVVTGRITEIGLRGVTMIVREGPYRNTASGFFSWAQVSPKLRGGVLKIGQMVRAEYLTTASFGLWHIAGGADENAG